MLGLVKGVVRGAVAWLVGLVATLVAGYTGVVAGVSDVSSAAAAYGRAHAVPPAVGLGLLIVVLAVGLAGFRAGRRTRSGVIGQLRSLVQSVRGTERNRLRTAVVAGALLAIGYAVVGVLVGLVIVGETATALVGGLVYGLVVGVPASMVGAYY